MKPSFEGRGQRQLALLAALAAVNHPVVPDGNASAPSIAPVITYPFGRPFDPIKRSSLPKEDKAARRRANQRAKKARRKNRGGS